MARLQISVLSCHPTLTVRGKANVTVCAFIWLQSARWLGFPGGTDNYIFDIPCGSGGRLKMFAPGRFRRSYAAVHCVCCGRIIASSNAFKRDIEGYVTCRHAMRPSN